MALIVATFRDMPDSEFPVLSVSPSVDSGYVMEGVHYYVNFGEGVLSPNSSEYSQPNNPHDFHIGRCRFIKKGDEWFYDDKIGRDPYKIVFGQKALEEYGSGKMFEKLTAMFGTD